MLILKVFLAIDLFLIIFIMLNKIAIYKIFLKTSTPCIATRFPYGTCLDEGSINKVKEGEKALKELGFNSCRLRLHNDIARIEIPERDFDSFLKKKNKITGSLKSIGFRYITLDMEAIRSGSMD